MADAHEQGGTRVVRVEVTNADLASGSRGDCAECPVARAVIRALGVDVRVFCGHSVEAYARMLDGRNTRLPLPRAADRFVRNFDVGVDVEPFSFDLEVPQ